MPDEIQYETLLNVSDEVNQILNDLNINSRLSVLEDFMNDKYNVTITNEEELVKGHVRYTANVTDANDANVVGALVRFEKTNGELLGESVTNSNGNAIINLTQDVDIYQLVAYVVSTPYSDMKKIYLKDADNLFQLNVWSGTDVTSTRLGFTTGAGVESASNSDWSVIGDNSLRFKKVGNSNFFVYANSNEFLGFTTLTAKADILTGEESVVVRLGTANYQNITQTTVPASNEPQTVILSATVPPGETIGRLQFLPQTDDKFSYVDNLCLFGSGSGGIEYYFYDPGTNTSANWRKWNENGTITASSTGKVFECTTDVGFLVFANKHGTNNGVYDYNAPYFVEFDVVSQTNTPVFQIYDDETERIYEKNLSATGHYKFGYDGTTVSCWIDDVEQTGTDIEFSNTRIGFRIGVGKTVKVKDFQIYNNAD